MTIVLDEQQFAEMERALRERVNLALADACRLDISAMPAHKAQRDREYQAAVALYKHVTGRSPISGEVQP